MPELSFHPLADLFPLLEGGEFEALVGDIREHGQREPIVLHGGAILDGRNRYRACRAADVEPRTVPFGGADPVSFVVSANLRRRHMNESQRAMVAAKLANISHGGDRRSDQAANLPLEGRPRPVSPEVPAGRVQGGPEAKPSVLGHPISQADAAKLLNVSERGVRTAKGVRENAVPEVVEKVERGELAVSAAGALARLPAEKQREVVAKGVEAVGTYLANSRSEGRPTTARGFNGALRGAVRETLGIPPRPQQDRAPQPPRDDGTGQQWTEWTRAVEHLADSTADLGRIARWLPVLRGKFLDDARRAQPRLKAWIEALERTDEAGHPS